MLNCINHYKLLFQSLFIVCCLTVLSSEGIAKQHAVLLDDNGQPITMEMLTLLSSGKSLLQTKPVPSFQSKNTSKQKVKTQKSITNKHANSRPELEKELLEDLKVGKTVRAMRLIKAGVKVNYKNSKGETPLSVAVAKAWASIARELLENGADIHHKMPRGVTLLHVASSRGYTDLAKVLMKYGLNPSTQTDKQWTSLHVAARYGHWALVREYVQRGVDPNIRNSDGKTALELARHLRHQGVVKILSRVTTARPLEGLLKKSRKSKKRKSKRHRSKKHKTKSKRKKR